MSGTAKLPFGDYKGRTLQDVWKKDRAYLAWLFKEKLSQEPYLNARGQDYLYQELVKLFLSKKKSPYQSDAKISNDELGNITIDVAVSKDPENLRKLYKIGRREFSLGMPSTTNNEVTSFLQWILN